MEDFSTLQCISRGLTLESRKIWFDYIPKYPWYSKSEETEHSVAWNLCIYSAEAVLTSSLTFSSSNQKKSDTLQSRLDSYYSLQVSWNWKISGNYRFWIKISLFLYPELQKKSTLVENLIPDLNSISFIFFYLSKVSGRAIILLKSIVLPKSNII